MTAHKHAEAMALYAQDAMETDKPWERWEFFGPLDSELVALESHPAWFLRNQYRRKPRVVERTVNYPEPMREAPEIGVEYFLTDPTAEKYFIAIDWEGDDFDRAWLARGLCHATKEAAIAHAKALIGDVE